MVPEQVAHQARYPASAGPEPFPESGAERLALPGLCLYFTPMPTVTFVEDVRLDPADVPSALSAVRDLARARGRDKVAWAVPASGALHDALSHAGLTPYDDPPLGPDYTAMALVAPPRGEAGADVTVREAVTREEYVAVGELAADVFEMSPEDRQGLVAATARRHELRAQGRTPMRSYLAFVDGRQVGEAQSTETAIGTNLSGCSVLPSARGRGVYRALVAARWRDAVERGLPALTVQAGPMSRPILLRLGFEVVDELALLCDRVPPP